MDTQHRRARPLPPAERRQAIVDAIIPLLLDKGSHVTSRQMAAAAGIAEGTIFRVFPDKQAVIEEAVRTSTDPTVVCAALADISESAPIDSQLEAAAAILLKRTERIASLHDILHAAHTATSRRRTGLPHFVRESNVAILSGLTQLLERHADRLRVSPIRASIALRGLVFANVHPMMASGEKTTPHEIVDLLLSGIADNGRPA